MKKKILWLGVSFLLVAALVLTSCGEAVPGEQEEEEEEEEVTPVGEQEEEEEEEEEEEVVGAPQYGGKLTHFMGWGTEAPTADICDGMWPTPMFASPVLENVIQGDFEQYGPRGTGQWGFTTERDIPEQFCKGVIAESWSVSLNKIIYDIRPGIIWASYGREDVMEPRELTPEDVAWSLNRFVDSQAGGNSSMRTANGGWIDSIYVEGDTVVVATSKFNADWLYRIAKGYGNAITAPEVVAAGASEWKNLVGTGPFMLNKYVMGSHLSFYRNPNYHDKTTIDGIEYDVPFVDELIWPIIQDESTQVASLRTAKLDLWYCTPQEYTDTLSQSSPLMIRHLWHHATVRYISLRYDQEPTSNLEVRRALMIAIDRAAVRDAVSFGGDIFSWPVYSGVEGVYTPMDELPAEVQELYVYDEDKARQMIIDAGYPNGITGMEIAAISRESDYVDMATMVAAYWTAIGVETTVRPMETTAHSAYVLSGEHKSDVSCKTNVNQLVQFRDMYLPKQPGEGGNSAYYDNPYFTEQLLKAEQMPDADARNAILKELAVITMQDLPYIPLSGNTIYSSWWPWVKNYFGEWEASAYAPGPIAAYLWIDQDLKEDLGY